MYLPAETPSRVRSAMLRRLVDCPFLVVAVQQITTPLTVFGSSLCEVQLSPMNGEMSRYLRLASGSTRGQ